MDYIHTFFQRRLQAADVQGGSPDSVRMPAVGMYPSSGGLIGMHLLLVQPCALPYNVRQVPIGYIFTHHAMQTSMSATDNQCEH